MAQSPKLSRWNILQDPLVRQLMKADGVDPSELAALMVDVSEKLRVVSPVPQQPAGPVVPVDGDGRPHGRCSFSHLRGSRTLH